MDPNTANQTPSQPVAPVQSEPVQTPPLVAPAQPATPPPPVPNTPPVMPSQPTPPPPAPRTPSSFSIKRVLTAVVLCVMIASVFVGAGLMFGVKQYFQVPPEEKVISKPQLSVSPLASSSASLASSSAMIDTSNWKTFTNPQYAYSVKYPTNLILSDGKHDTVIDMQSILFQESSLNSPGAPGLPSFFISVMPESTGNTRDVNIYNSLSKPTLDKVFSLPQNGALDLATSKEINGFATDTFKRVADVAIDNVPCIVIALENNHGGERRVFVKKNGYIYMIGTYWQDNKTLQAFNSFTTSFKFTTATPSAR